MNTCASYVALLDGYIDGILSPKEAEMVENHLKTCPDCAQYIADIQAIEADFPTVDDVALPENFTQSVMAEVAKHPRKTRKPSLAQRFALPAVACLAVLVYVGHDFGGTPTTETAISTAAVSTMMADAPMERAVAESDSTVLSANSPTVYEVTQGEAGDFFADFIGTDLGDGAVQYILTPGEFADLMTALDRTDAYPEEQTYLVVLCGEY